LPWPSGSLMTPNACWWRRISMGTLDLHNMDKQLAENSAMIGHMIPRNQVEAGMFVGETSARRPIDEIIFRGYMQAPVRGMVRQ